MGRPPSLNLRGSHTDIDRSRYKIIVEGIAGGTVPAVSGSRPPDALNLWPSILDGSAGPRTEVVHQVENQYSCDTTQGGGGCCSSMRMGAGKRLLGGRHFLLKLIILPRQARDKHRNS